MKLAAHLGLRGEYCVEIVRHGKVTKSLRFDNLITDFGLDDLPATYGWGWCRIGTGTTPADPADIALEAQVAVVQNTARVESIIAPQVDPGWPFRLEIVHEFPAGTFDGLTAISEVGISYTETRNLFSRALLADTAGNPVTIAPQADEVLVVRYYLYGYLSRVDWTDTLTHSHPQGDQSVTVTGRAVGLNYAQTRGNQGVRFDIFGYASGPVGGDPAEYPPFAKERDDLLDNGVDDNDHYLGGDTTDQSPDRVTDAYVPGSLKLTGTAKWPQGRANYATGIGSLFLQTSFGRWQFTFSPKLTKTNATELSVGFEMTWGRKT